MRYFWTCATSFVLGLVLCGCANTLSLTMDKDKPPIDQSSLSPKVKEKKYTKLMVIPPSGTARGTFEPKIVLFEREFLKRGITVISGAITGRVVLETGDTSAKKSESAAELSDMERALIMAKKTGADAILQIGAFQWTAATKPTRFFVAEDVPNGRFREVTADEFNAWSELKKAYASQELSFIGRLVDVDNGEVIASFDLKMPANYLLPGNYTARLSGADDVMSESFQYERRWATVDQVGNYIWHSNLPWCTEDSIKRVEATLIEYVVKRITGQ